MINNGAIFPSQLELVNEHNTFDLKIMFSKENCAEYLPPRFFLLLHIE